MFNYSIYGDVSISKTEPDKQQDQQRNAQEVQMPAKSYPKAEPNLPGASIFPKDNFVPGKTDPSKETK